MTRKRIGLLVLVGSLLLLLVVPLSHAITNSYFEDFTTTAKKDGDFTDAWWDTATGKLKLRSFNSSLVGYYITSENALGIDVDGDYAYVAAGSEGLIVFDITTNTPGPGYIGAYDTPGSAWGVKADGDLVYVADLNTGLMVIDVTDPSTPTLYGSYDTPGWARDVVLDGKYAYVADGTDGGIQVIDVSDPSTPVGMGSYNTPGEAISVDVKGHYAYIADRGSGLVVVDIANKSWPILADFYDTTGDCWGVAVSGDYAFTGNALQGIRVFDISNPLDIGYVTTITPAGSHRRLSVQGDYLYAAAYGQLYTIDINDPSLPVVVGSYTSMYIATTAVVDGEHAYVADGSGGLRVLDVNESFPPFRIAERASTGSCEAVHAEGDLLYMVQSSGATPFKVFDIRFPDGPTEIGSCDVGGYDLFVAGDLAYTADGSSGLQIVDISDPVNPVAIGNYNTSDNATGVAVHGNYAYVAENFAGLRVIDVSDPMNPSVVGTYNTPDRATDVVVKGNLAYVADGSSGLQIIDISTPSSPTLVGSYDTPGFAVELAVAGNLVLVADSDDGLAVIKVLNPSVPQHLAQMSTPAWAVSVVISGNYAFVGTGASVQRVDIQNPSFPTPVDDAPVDDYARGLCVFGDYIFVADADDGLKTFRAFHHKFTNANSARSYPVNDTDDTIVRARLTTTEIEIIDWELSSDGGGHFESADPGEWVRFSSPGASLAWRSTLFPKGMGTPYCSELTLDWLYEFPAIEYVEDVPDDEGGTVKLKFAPSGYDFADETEHPIDEYIVWRRVLETSTGIETSSAKENPAFFAEMPPGTWEEQITITASNAAGHISYLNTAVDLGAPGAAPSVFVVSAHTAEPSTWWVSPPESAYSVDNIAPAAPTNFSVTYNTPKGNHLHFSRSVSPDVHYHAVYRGETEDFSIDGLTPVTKRGGTNWDDPILEGWRYHYKITAVDIAGNESDAVMPGTVSGIDTPVNPEHFALHANTPNPFNPSTVIHYDVPAGGGHVTIKVYDVTGRFVRSLVAEHRPAGTHEIEWDGNDGSGVMTSSGVYFCRLEARGIVQTRRMVLLK